MARLSARRRAEARSGWLLVAPSLVGVGFFLLVPVLLVILLSFMKWNLVSDPTWVGLDNYRSLFGSDRFWSSLSVTAIFTLIAIPFSLAIGLLIALALNRRLPGSGIIQLLYVLPWVCAPLTLGIVWSWMLSPREGFINRVLGTNLQFMSDPDLALYTVAFVYVWQNVGYISLFFLAGLQNIPTSVVEAAKLDGAGSIRMILKIILPLLRPTTFFVLVTSMISSIQVFDLVYGLTGGTPGYPAGSTNVIAANIYQNANSTPPIMGLASASAVVLLVIIVAITLVQQRYFARRTTYDMT